ncbi:hypothetical protein A5648_01300 [Mycolicibacter sinensis]|uniref:Uncharacterized protein n=2 Tax=Mycolicibacter sinensis (strain JDM601) TaxID=875328 RepID=A0A1A3U179_MYCSD|nr:hypothetical protein A5648_01300 [Mycolicibacter sinensis]
MLGPSDWDDEDLLTVVGASDRLVGEIAACRERIRQAEEVLDGAADDAEAAAILAAERQRSDDLMRAVERIKDAQANAPR